MESIYLFFHQIFPREVIIHFWTVFLSVCADWSCQFSHRSDRYDWTIKKLVPLSLSRTIPSFVFFSSTNITRFLASPHGDLRTPPWNPCSNLRFGALNRGKALPSSLQPFSFVCALPVRPKLQSGLMFMFS
jgi:hypothetical protein